MMTEKIYPSTDYHQILEEIYVYRNLYLSRLVLGDANNRFLLQHVAKEFNIHYLIIISYLINLCY